LKFNKNYLSFHSGCVASYPRQYFRLTCRLAQERVTYNKEIQTADLESDSGSTSDGEVREPILRERETTVESERTLEEESAILDREIEEEIRGMHFFFMSRFSVERTRRLDGGGKNQHSCRS